MKTETPYLSFRNEGHEIYSETLPTKFEDLKTQGYLALARERLALLRKAMPCGTWQVTIEQRVGETYLIVDAESGKEVQP